MTIEWEHIEKNLEEGDPFDHLLAYDETGFVTLRLRQVNDEEEPEQDGSWVCAWTVQLAPKRWSLPEIEDWMKRVAERINEEVVRANDDDDLDT